jgi:ATP-binding protein involved in chromosome partitioning
MEIFGRGGAKGMAEALNVPFLGEVPLDPAMRKGCDEGKPVTALAPQSDIATRFKNIAERVLKALK